MPPRVRPNRKPDQQQHKSQAARRCSFVQAVTQRDKARWRTRKGGEPQRLSPALQAPPTLRRSSLRPRGRHPYDAQFTAENMSSEAADIMDVDGGRAAPGAPTQTAADSLLVMQAQSTPGQSGCARPCASLSRPSRSLTFRIDRACAAIWRRHSSPPAKCAGKKKQRGRITYF